MPAPDNLILLADGTYADPKAMKKGGDGVLRHENGVHAATFATGEPLTLGDIPVESKSADAAAMGTEEPAPVVERPAPAAPRPAVRGEAEAG